MKSPQYELSGAADVFNLAGQTGNDPWRLDRERWEASEREREGREYAARMQHTFEQCPGFIGCDMPTSELSKGRVVVEPGRVLEAMTWLKRRFRASESIELSEDEGGICIEVAAKQRRSPNGGRRVKINFGKIEQFTFEL